MTQASIAGGLWLPGWQHPYVSLGSSTPALGNTPTMDAATEKVAYVGDIYIDGRATSKTFSSAGAKIHFRTGTVTFANAGTTLRVGIQDVSNTAGPGMQADGTFDTYDDLVGATDTIGSTTWVTATMSVGTKTISHGDLIAVVFDMTARAGADSVILQGPALGSANMRPQVMSFVAGAWATASAAVLPNVVIEFDDGTLATIDGAACCSFTPHSYADATNPDERGLIFQVPWPCKIDAFWVNMLGGAATSDWSLKLYSDPLGTPSLIGPGAGSTALSQFGEHLAAAGGTIERFGLFTFPAEISLSANTDYCIALKATGTTTFEWTSLVFNAAGHRKLMIPNGANLRKGHRNADTGAFTEVTTEVPLMGVRISSFDDGAGGGGSGGQRIFGG